MHERPQKIWAAQYQGPTSPEYHSRSIMDIDDGLMEFTDGKNTVAFDYLMASGMKRAKLMGRKEFTLLDIGSGDGGIFQDFLSTPLIAEDSRAFLAQNPDFKVLFIGITDSPDTKSHNTYKSFEIDQLRLSDEDKRINSQVEVRNMHWSLTRTQSLADFLDANAIGSVDLAMATESLRYVSTRVFKDTVETVVQRLVIGGRFVCQGFTGTEPGFSSRKDNYFKVTPYSEKDPTVWKRLLRTLGTDRELEDEYPDLTKQQLQEGLDRAIGVYVRLGLLDQEEVEHDIRFVEANPLNNLISPLDIIRAKAALMLSKGFNRLYIKNRQQARLDKNGVLDSFDQSQVAVKPRCYIDKFLLTRLS